MKRGDLYRVRHPDAAREGHRRRGRSAVLLDQRLGTELLVFEETSTGASNDLEKATDLARRMVTELGMSEALGPVRYAGPAGAGYLGGQAATRNLSPDIENLIDAEIRRLLDGAQEAALELLRTHEAALREIARVLQEDEVIDGDTVSRIAVEAQDE